MTARGIATPGSVGPIGPLAWSATSGMAVRSVANRAHNGHTSVAHREVDAKARWAAGGPMAATGADRESGAGAARRSSAAVVVPRTSGPVIPFDASKARQPDDVDAAIDDIFGQSTDERPGWFDVGLFVVGVGLLAWALAAHASGIVLVGGVAAVVLGSALPVRSLVRALSGHRVQRARRHVAAQGYTLDVSHPAVAALVTAYAELQQAAAAEGVLLPDQAISAAHLALVEAASLLGGSPPSAPAQVDYVEKRSKAISALTVQLQRQHQAWLDARAKDAVASQDEQTSWATSVTEARNELDASDHLDSLDSLTQLTQQFKGDGDAKS